MSKSKKLKSKEITSTILHGPYQREIEANTQYGTKYTFHPEFPYQARLHETIHINLNRLNLIEEYCDITGSFLHSFIEDAIYEKMDREVREPNLEKIGRHIRQRFLRKWDTSIQNRASLQDHLAN